MTKKWRVTTVRLEVLSNKLEDLEADGWQVFQLLGPTTVNMYTIVTSRMEQ